MLKAHNNVGNIVCVHLSHPRRKDREKMEEERKASILAQLPPEEEAAFLEALKDPEKRRKIIKILEEAELRRG